MVSARYKAAWPVIFTAGCVLERGLRCPGMNIAKTMGVIATPPPPKI